MTLSKVGRNVRQGKKKRQAILEAASEIFLEAGYGAATMDGIATCANVSKQTIYHHFGSKEVLFAAIIEERCEEFLAAIEDFGFDAKDLAVNMRTLGRNFLTRVLTPSSLALHRLVVSEANRFPELGRLSYESGPKRLIDRLAVFLSAQAKHSGLEISAPETAAEQFFGTLLGFIQLKAILYGEFEDCIERIDYYVDYAVETFIKGHSRPKEHIEH